MISLFKSYKRRLEAKDLEIKMLRERLARLHEYICILEKEANKGDR